MLSPVAQGLFHLQNEGLVSGGSPSRIDHQAWNSLGE